MKNDASPLNGTTVSINIGRSTGIILLMILICYPATAQFKVKFKSDPTPSPLQQYLEQASHRSGSPEGISGPTAGSLWSPRGTLNDSVRDLRASQIDDLVTIVVNETSSAVSQGTTKTSRASAANATVNSFAGTLNTTSPWVNLAKVSGSNSINGTGATTRGATVTATLTGRIAGVLPNGYLIVEANKLVQINGESQTIVVRGVIRPADIDLTNTVASNRLSQVEVSVNGKGVVNDAVKRPMFLYRLILGLLPF